MNIAAAENVKERLMPAVEELRDSIAAKVEEWKDVVKIGRTHMQDATPITLGEKLRYMHRNPVKRGLVGSPEQWKWSSYRFYLLGEEGQVKSTRFEELTSDDIPLIAAR
jgi:hypothetical protein